MATLIDQSWVEVKLTLSDAQFGRIMRTSDGVIGRPLEVRWQAGGEPFIYEAEIVRIGARIASSSGGVNVYARIKNPLNPRRCAPGHLSSARA